MSDLQDLIATNAVRAYNEGFERGATEERERIISMAKNLAHTDDDRACCDFDEGLLWLIRKIKNGEQE